MIEDKKQNLQLIAALCATFISCGVLFLVREEVFYRYGFENLGLIVCFILVVSIAVAICFWFILVVNKVRRIKGKESMSAFRCFAVADGILMAGTIVYAVYDIMADTGFLPGLFGWVLLSYVVPVLLLLLVGDVIAGYLYQKKHGHK